MARFWTRPLTKPRTTYPYIRSYCGVELLIVAAHCLLLALTNTHGLVLIGYLVLVGIETFSCAIDMVRSQRRGAGQRHRDHRMTAGVLLGHWLMLVAHAEPGVALVAHLVLAGIETVRLLWHLLASNPQNGCPDTPPVHADGVGEQQVREHDGAPVPATSGANRASELAS